MKRIYHSILLILVIVSSLFVSASAPAQTSDVNLRINKMEIDIWPEYDQPSTLVIYRISFLSLASFPARVSFKIPASAGDPYSVAMKDLDGLLYDLEYVSIPDGDWNRIEFITSTPDVQIEFYDPIQQISTTERSYSFHWISDYPVDQFSMVVQKPRYATTLTIQPDFGKGVTNPDDNLLYYTNEVGAIKAGDSINIALDYLKTNAQLSADTLPVHAAAPLPRNTPLADLLTLIWQNSSLMITGSLLFAGILLMVLIFFLTTKKGKHKADKRLEKNTSSPVHDVPLLGEDAETYCHVCGKRARPGDVFCRACGSKLDQR